MTVDSRVPNRSDATSTTSLITVQGEGSQHDWTKTRLTFYVVPPAHGQLHNANGPLVGGDPSCLSVWGWFAGSCGR